MDRFIEHFDGTRHCRVDEAAPPAGLTSEEWQEICEDDSIDSLIRMSRALGVSDDETRLLGSAILSPKDQLELTAMLDSQPKPGI